MFKAKLIEDKSYYSFKSKGLWISLLSSSVVGTLANVFNFPFLVNIIVIVLLISVIYLQKKNFDRMAQTVGHSQVEIDEQEIRIMSNKKLVETIRLSDVDKLVIKEEYKIPGETIKEMHQEMGGKIFDNYIIVHLNEEEKNFDFELDSHYMIIQLNKIIKEWKCHGFKVEELAAG